MRSQTCHCCRVFLSAGGELTGVEGERGRERETSRRDYTCLRIIWGQRRRPPSPIARNSPPTSPSVRTPPGAAEAEGEAVRIERAKVSPGVSERLPMEFGC